MPATSPSCRKSSITWRLGKLSFFPWSNSLFPKFCIYEKFLKFELLPIRASAKIFFYLLQIKQLDFSELNPQKIVCHIEREKEHILLVSLEKVYYFSMKRFAGRVLRSLKAAYEFRGAIWTDRITRWLWQKFWMNCPRITSMSRPKLKPGSVRWVWNYRFEVLNIWDWIFQFQFWLRIFLTDNFGYKFLISTPAPIIFSLIEFSLHSRLYQTILVCNWTTKANTYSSRHTKSRAKRDW